MKKKILAMTLLAALLASILSVTAFAAPSGGTVAAEARDGVVRIVALRPDGYYSLGSGFGIGKVGEETDTFVTNWHVLCDIYEVDGMVGELPAVSVWILKNSSAWNPVTGLDTTQCIPCEILYVEEGGYPDMGVIKAAEPMTGRVAMPLLASDNDLEVGDSVWALGYPSSSDSTEQGIYGEKWVAGVEDVTITSGVVSRFTTAATYGNTRIIQHDAQINHGNSGGPLLNDNGAVVGINTYGFGQDVFSGDGQSYAAVRISHVIEVLDDLELEYELYEEGLPVGAIVGIVAAVVIVAAAVVLVILKKKGKLGGKKPAKKNEKKGEESNELRFQCQSGAFAGQRFSINGMVRIGRDPNRNDLVFPANTQGISGAHCVLTMEGGKLYLKDLGSTYGTFVMPGKKLQPNQPVQLNVGDKFCLGSEREVFIITRKGGM